jgi:hypothetical protein
MTACGTDATSSESIEVVQEELAQGTCAQAPADVVRSNQIDPPLVSPQSYNTCYKGYIVDVDDLSPTYTGSGNVRDAMIAVEYADTPITSQTTCEDTLVRAIFYKEYLNTSTSTGGGGVPEWQVVKDAATFGTWTSVFGTGVCNIGVNLMGLQAGATYRVAATARTPSNATRKVSIGTYKPVNVK